jgi:hypothetical protein
VGLISSVVWVAVEVALYAIRAGAGTSTLPAAFEVLIGPIVLLALGIPARLGRRDWAFAFVTMSFFTASTCFVLAVIFESIRYGGINSN